MYDRSREMEIAVLQQSVISTLISSTGNIIVKKRIENYLKGQFPFIDKNISDNITRAASVNGKIMPEIKWTSVAGRKMTQSWVLSRLLRELPY